MTVKCATPGPHDDAVRRSRFPVGRLFLLYLGFVVYGSLVPLDYRTVPWERAWEIFGQIRLLDVGAAGRADWVANGVLYVPLGFLTASLLGGRGAATRVAAALGALGFVVVLAVMVEFAQIFFPPRTVSLNDLFAEFIGGGLGAGLATAAVDRLRRLQTAWVEGVERFAPHLVEVYALLYCVFSFFPFDFLMSAGELAEKASSGGWGWLWAGGGGRGGTVAGVAKLAAEAVAAVPLGWLLGARGWAPGRALAGGAVLGLTIEAGQFFLVSGVTQGFSVLIRAVGVAAGAVAWGWRRRLDPLALAAAIRRFGPVLVTLYLLALVAVTGWFELPWRDGAEAAGVLEKVRFLPFYYHYYTTEQAALLSLTSVCLMYAPVGLLAWASFLGTGGAAMLAVLLATAVEASKLFLVGLHPDPTNLLIAAVAAWLACWLVQGAEGFARRVGPKGGAAALADRNGDAGSSQPRSGPASAGSIESMSARYHVDDGPLNSHPLPALRDPGDGSLKWPGAKGLGVLVTVGAVVVWGVISFPLEPVLLGLALAGYGAILWWRPRYLWVVVPAALAMLDLAPWSGRFFFDEFDLLLLVSVAVGYARLAPASAGGRDWPLRLTAGLVALAYGIATLRGLLPWQWLDANAFSHYYSSLNALRIAKGAVWAFILAGLVGRFTGAGVAVNRHFGTGMVLGLAGTTAVVIWERLVFPGLFNFTDVYRVTGPFSQMHTGGADLECYLTAAVPFLVWKLFERRSWFERCLGVLLLSASTYALMVTFSRAGYVGYGLAVVMTAGLALLRRHRQAAESGPIDIPSVRRRGLGVASVLALTLAVAAPVFLGGFAQERLARTGHDLAVRVDHWRDALAMRDSGLSTELFGMGLGRFPSTHLWRSGETRAASYMIGEDGGQPFLRLGAGSPLYVEQFVAVQPGREYVLSLRARSPAGASRISVSLCEKWLLTSARCVFETQEVPGSNWQQLTIEIPVGEVGSGPWYRARPVKLSLYNAGKDAVVDVDELRLVGRGGKNLLTNGAFTDGMDRWFFSVDVDLPWHIWSMPVAVLFEMGWLGVAALGGLAILGLVRATKCAWSGDKTTASLLAAGLGWTCLGVVDSMADSPRLLMLGLFVVFWICGLKSMRPHVAKRAAEG